MKLYLEIYFNFLAAIHTAIAEGEDDIEARRVKEYSPELIDQLAEEVLSEI